MIKRYCDLVPVLRPMLGYVKRWAKPLGLNHPSTGQGPPTFSTYAFALMVIGYLQMRGWAPNLQHEIESSSEGGEEGVFWLRESVSLHACKIRCDTRYHRKNDWSPDVEIELKEALHGWFTFWSEGFDYEGSMMDIKSGGVVPRPTKQPEMLTSEGSQRSTKTVLVLNPDLPCVEADDLSEHSDTELAEISSGKEEAEAVVVFEEREEEEDQEDQDSTNLEVEENTKSTFAKESICIIDPFVRTKNVTRSITKKNLELFRSNCQRVAILMSCGASISEVIDLEDDPVFQPHSFAKKRNFVRQPLYPRAERPDHKPRPPPQSELDAQGSRENVTTERSRLFNELIRPLLPDSKSSRDKGKDRERAPLDDHAGDIGVAFSQPPPRLQPTAGSSSHSIAASRSNFNKETRKRAWTERQVRTEEGKQRGSADNVDLTAVKKVMSNETPTLSDARKGQPAEVPSPLEMTSGSTSLPSKKSKNRRSKRGKQGEGQEEMKKSAKQSAPIPGHLGSRGSPARFDKDIIHVPQEHSVSAGEPQKGSGDLPISAIQLRLKKDIRGQGPGAPKLTETTRKG
ncbi:hypothetical protein SERLA73DRAFT_188220 [Serpula lacrymans var. lacrymans S7.3]|uniref:PAP-associated domain-containing protein n=2 Tax=Serpula lacrymans var. lacrymans TaxID=341189 RepID=F8QAY8_SERL3|nr:uncharacterized protein SERLADRAFT_478260 [Serpula lacrymans var. lacrymans S7.9]EGN94374.1 hypothetical protein SERLA73DRAFT_188220 [Serpula lacrymans var. lacrymans S7.3]EGO19857.1 hypothetical protein SERLADRAFT_478260 [Serpula lacrymans var. lacrymans S7.9]